MKIEVRNLEEGELDGFDLLVYAVGYEDRSSFVARRYSNSSKVKVGYYFSGGHILSFSKNDAFSRESGALHLEQGSSLEALLRHSAPDRSFVGAKILLDVSSLNRGAMADIFAELLDSDFFGSSTIFVSYAVAKYRDPNLTEVDFLDFSPLQRFGGWTSNPDLPAVLVLGLGYETDHAVGAVESLDPSSTFIFFPIGSDSRFEARVLSANAPILEIVNEARIIKYPVLSPYQTYWQMRSLILSLLGVSRIVLVPMGPKIFCSLCLICQRVFGDEVSVWRASGHTLVNAIDAEAEGSIVGYRIDRS